MPVIKAEDLPIHATEWHKFLFTEQAQQFIKEYRALCQKHQLCVTADPCGELSIDDLRDSSFRPFRAEQNCHCPECTAWWEQKAREQL